MRTGAVRIITAAIVGIAVVLSCWILGGSIVRARGTDEEIRVTGSASMPVKSDLAIWSARVAYRDASVTAGYAATKKGVDKLIAYLKGKGFTDEEIIRGALRTNTLYQSSGNSNGYEQADTFRPIAGYDVSQNVTVRSKKIEAVDQISRESTELVAQGVALESEPPQFLYTEVTQTKREILGAAAEDALKRAQEIARKAGSDVGTVRSARMSPLQITPIFSTEVSGMGQNDTTSIDKAITAIVTLTFAVK